MSLSKALLVACSIAAASAKPLSPSKVVRQAAGPVEPSSFPLGDECGNEWKYMNFDPENDADKAHLQKLHDVICTGELRAISAWGAQAAEDSKTSINVVYDVFFDTKDDTNSKVEDVLKKISGQSSSEGMIGEIVKTMVVDNADFGESSGNSCDEEGTLAYTATDEDFDQREKIHFCDIAYDRPASGPAIDCGSLDSYPSTKMDTFSRVVLHETLHYSSVGPDSKLGEQIVDQQNDDGIVAYDPERAHGLNDPDQDNQPGKAESNADNYAWMSLDSWISYLCTAEDEQEAWDSYFPDDPPDYE
ncbi:hypothetical protein ACJ41O_001573 [Fusarium nematophilum]